MVAYGEFSVAIDRLTSQPLKQFLITFNQLVCQSGELLVGAHLFDLGAQGVDDEVV